MVSAALLDGLVFNLLSPLQNALAVSEVDIGWRQVVETFVVAAMIVVVDEVVHRTLQMAG